MAGLRLPSTFLQQGGGGLQIPLPPDLRPHREKRDKMGVPELTLPSLGCLHPALGNGKRRDRQ